MIGALAATTEQPYVHPQQGAGSNALAAGSLRQVSLSGFTVCHVTWTRITCTHMACTQMICTYAACTHTAPNNACVSTGQELHQRPQAINSIDPDAAVFAVGLHVQVYVWHCMFVLQDLFLSGWFSMQTSQVPGLTCGLASRDRQSNQSSGSNLDETVVLTAMTAELHVQVNKLRNQIVLGIVCMYTFKLFYSAGSQLRCH